MKVVITGGAGFIGTNLSKRLLNEGYGVVALDDLSSGSEENVRASGVHLIRGSVLDEDTLNAAFEDTDVVIHLAASTSVQGSIEDPESTLEVNSTGTLKVLNAIRRHGIKKLVMASSAAVYGNNPAARQSEDLLPMPLSPYAASKLAAEAYATAFGHSYGIETLVFRFFNVYGPFQRADDTYASVIPSFIEAALSGQPLRVDGDGRQTRDFTYVDSVSDVIARAIVDSVTFPEAVNLASGTQTSILDLVLAMEQILGRELPIYHAEARVGDVLRSQADNARLHDLFPDLLFATLSEGLSSTFAWYQNCRRGV